MYSGKEKVGSPTQGGNERKVLSVRESGELLRGRESGEATWGGRNVGGSGRKKKRLFSEIGFRLHKIYKSTTK